ncbi:hypothetical protein [Microterricola gilva]|nr:hypothetical protein [Microterricola gilva]
MGGTIHDGSPIARMILDRNEFHRIFVKESEGGASLVEEASRIAG